MKSALQIIGCVFGVRGYAGYAARTGVRLVKTDADDLTDSQANLLDVMVKDPRVQKLVEDAFDLADVIEAENELEKARPWLDLAQLIG